MCIVETFRPGKLLAIQYTSFPSSIDVTFLFSFDVVINKLAFPSDIACLDRLVMSIDDMYQVILAGGLQSDVIQVRFICCPAFSVFNGGERVTDVTGAVIIQ